MKNNKNKYGVVEVDGKYFRLRSNGKPGVEVPYCNHTMTKAELFGRILSFARQGTKFWSPAQAKLIEGRRKYTGEDKRIKWEYQCELCKGWFLKRKTKPNIEIDHIVPCGGINDWDKIVGWYQRAYVDTEGYQRLCSICHDKKSLKERLMSTIIDDERLKYLATNAGKVYEEILNKKENEWEYYCDESYYNYWAVKRKKEKDFGSAYIFHLNNEYQAKLLCKLLNKEKQ